MTTVREIDRLVRSDDATAARLWPRLGQKVRDAYLHDRDAWVVIRRGLEPGGSVPAATLAAQQRVFSGWARAFRAAAGGKTKHAQPASASRLPAARPPAAAPALAPMLMAPAATAAAKVNSSAGTAVAGGLVLAGLIAVAARRKRT